MPFVCSVQCVFRTAWFYCGGKYESGTGADVGNLEHVSAERIQTELVKLLVSDHPDYLRTAWETGLTREFLPEFDACMETEQNTPHHCYTVGEHILKSLTEIENDRLLRITMLLHDIAKPVVKRQMRMEETTLRLTPAGESWQERSCAV